MGGGEGGRKRKRRKRRRKRKRKRRKNKGKGGEQDNLPPGWKDKPLVGLKVFTNNCRGYNSKKESIEADVIKAVCPDVINLSETLYRNKSKINHEKYVSFTQNQADGAGGGGIVTMVSSHLKSHTTKVVADNKYDEFMVTRLDHVKPPLNIVHIYGQNEGRAGQQNILEGWTQILAELGKIEARKEVALVVGDLNRAVGNNELGVKGNTNKVSYGGN